MTAHPIRVLLVDDQRLLRDGLRTLLGLYPDLQVVGEAADGLEAETAVAQLQPHVVLMDLRMPRRDGVDATRALTARWPSLTVLVLTTFEEDDLVFAAIQAGAAGYLLKDLGADNLAEAIRAAARGEAPLQPRIAAKVLQRLRTDPTGPSAAPHPAVAALTDRERAVLALVAQGDDNRKIALALALSEGTVKNYVSAILAKTGARDRTQAALIGLRAGLRPHG